ncbi:Protein BEAN [Pteropus alecto]|uniref:Protein BEAN n=1 Tax=Pteropus alecto TaxID=9402 RepID=L5KST6_PTEAL|nr:Protein BEAN [Pteropus alecto]
MEEEGMWRGLCPSSVSSLSLFPVARNNRTSTDSMFPENLEDGDDAISPILVVSTVIGVLVILSCMTIIGGSICKAQFRQRRNRRRYEEEDENSQGSDGSIYSHLTYRMRHACGFAEGWSSPSVLSTDENVDGMMLQELYSDIPPRYEECIGPGATQLYIPTDAPPPYSLIDAYPVLESTLCWMTGNNNNPGGYQAQRIQGQGGLCTISMDALPSYESVCGAGPEPGPQRSRASAGPNWILVSGTEMTV